VALEVGLMNILVGLGLEPGAGEKLGDELGKGVLPVGEKLGKDLGARIGKGLESAGKNISKFVTGPLLAGAGGLVAAGLKYDEALDLIRAGTGATGEEFDSLAQSFRTVAEDAAVPYEAIAPVITDLSRRLDLTGEPLERLAGQVLDLYQITGQPPDTEAIAKIFRTFNVAAEDQAGLLDLIFRTTQDTGIGFDDLTNSVLGSAEQFKALGFSSEEAVGLIGELESRGLNTSAVLASLNKGIAASIKGNADLEKVDEKRTKSLKTIEEATGDLEVAEQKLAELRANPKAAQSAILAQENTVKKLTGVIEDETAAVASYTKQLEDGAKNAGATTEQFFQQQVAEIERLLAIGDDAAAADLASQIFGTRNFVAISSAIKDGVFNAETLAAAASTTGDTIGGVADETADFAEEFQKFKNGLNNDLGEVAQEIFPDIKDAIVELTPTIKDLLVEFASLSKEVVPVIRDVFKAALPIIKDLVDRFKDLSPETKENVAKLIALTAVFGPLLTPLGKLVGIVANLTTTFKTLGPILAKAFAPLLANPAILGFIAAALVIAGLAYLIIKNWDAISEFFVGVFDAIGAAGAAVYEALVGFFVGLVEAIIGAFTGLLDIVGAIWDGIRAGAQFVVDLIVGYFQTLLTIYSTIWDGIRAVAQGVWDGLVAAAQFVVDTIIGYFTGLRDIYAGIWRAVGDLAKAAFDRVVGIASGVVSRIRGAFSGLAGFFAGVWTAIRNTASAALDAVLGIFTRVRDRIADFVKSILNIPGKIKDAFGSFGASIFRADGGPVEGGNPYIVGERGPELVVPRASGVVVSNEQLAGVLSGVGGGKGDTYEITITNPEPEPASTSIPQALRRASYLRSR
jgi:phage-related minor tail protein